MQKMNSLDALALVYQTAVVIFGDFRLCLVCALPEELV